MSNKWRFEQVAVCVDDHKLVSIYFRTNLQTTATIGKGWQATPTLLKAPDDTFVCGLEVSVELKAERREIMTLRAVYASIPPTTAVKKVE